MSFIKDLFSMIFNNKYDTEKKDPEKKRSVIPIYGAIGYDLMVNNKKHKIIIFADKHDDIENCGDSIDMDDFFKKIITETSTEVFIEEVERTDKTKNIALIWKGSEHTEGLKDLYINNQKDIYGIDIRHHLTYF